MSAKVNGRHEKGWGKVDLFSVGIIVAKLPGLKRGLLTHDVDVRQIREVVSRYQNPSTMIFCIDLQDRIFMMSMYALYLMHTREAKGHRRQTCICLLIWYHIFMNDHRNSCVCVDKVGSHNFLDGKQAWQIGPQFTMALIYAGVFCFSAIP